MVRFGIQSRNTEEMFSHWWNYIKIAGNFYIYTSSDLPTIFIQTYTFSISGKAVSSSDIWQIFLYFYVFFLYIYWQIM